MKDETDSWVVLIQVWFNMITGQTCTVEQAVTLREQLKKYAEEKGSGQASPNSASTPFCSCSNGCPKPKVVCGNCGLEIRVCK